MKIDYTKLFKKLKAEGITQKRFKEEAKINANTLIRFRRSESVTTEIICRICDYFCCMPDEIMEFIPEENYPDLKAKKQRKKDLESQIAELQAKLKTLQEGEE